MYIILVSVPPQLHPQVFIYYVCIVLVVLFWIRTTFLCEAFHLFLFQVATMCIVQSIASVILV